MKDIFTKICILSAFLILVFSSLKAQATTSYFSDDFENGLNNKDIVAYHGTSLEVIKDLISNGKIKGGFGGHEIQERAVLPPQLSIVLKGSEVEPGWLIRSDGNNEIRFASEYAEGLARDHAVAAMLGFNPTDERFRGVTLGPGDQAQLINRGVVTESNLMKAIQEAKKRSGVVLGFNKDILKDFKLRPHGRHHEKGEEMVVCPEGIDYKYVIGLEPEGEFEKSFFEDLQNKFA